MTSVHIRLLGPLEIVGADGESIVVGAQKRRAVCAVLAANLNHVVGVERLADLVWDGEPPLQARTAIHVHVSALRKVLHDHTPLRLLTRSPGYLLQGEQDTVDAVRLAALVERAAGADRHTAIELLSEAVGLWRGTPLSDVSTGRLGAIADGLQAEYLTALERLGDHLVRSGRTGHFAEVQDAVSQEPLREGLVRICMQMLYQQHRQADALDLYDRTRRALADELSVDPGLELRATYQSILAGQPVVEEPDDEPAAAAAESPAIPAQLPRRPAVFAGRDEQLTWLADHGGVGEVMLFSGGAGTGKTTLALEWAHRLAGEHPDGQLFVDLRSYDGSGGTSTAHALAGVLRALGVDSATVPDSVDERGALLRTVLAGKRVLLMIDNAHTAEQVGALLPASPLCTVLVTSRHRMESLLVFTSAKFITVPVLDRTHAQTLLERLVGTARTAGEPAAVARLAGLCGGLPLALRICAARLAAHPSWPIAALVDDLTGERQRLAGLATSDKGLSLPAALVTTQRTLDGATNELFGLLGASPLAMIDSHAAAALAGWPLHRARSCLNNLAGAHLLDEIGPHQYTCHDLIRLHCRQLAAEMPDDVASKARRRLVRHYLDTMIAAHDVITDIHIGSGDPIQDPAVLTRFSSSQQAFGWFKDTEPAMVELVELSCELGMVEAAWALVDQSSTLFYRAGNLDIWRDVAKRAWQEAVRGGDVEGGVVAEYRYADALCVLGRLGEAKQHLLDTFHRAGPDTPALRLFNISYHLGWVCMDREEYSESIHWFQRCIALNADIGSNLHGYVHAQLAFAAYNKADWSLAEEHIETALDICRVADQPELKNYVLCTQGRIQEHHGDLDGAWQSYQEALSLSLELGDDRCRADALRGMGSVQHSRRNFAEARLVWQTEYDLRRRLGSSEADTVATRLAELELEQAAGH